MTKQLYDRPPVRVLVLLTVMLAVLIAGILAAAPVAEAGPALQTTTSLAVVPAELELGCNEAGRIDIRINDVTDLYGVDVKLSYDPALVEVVDANPSVPGVQISPGNMPDVSDGQGLVQVNSVDTQNGTISYAAIRLNPAPPQSGSGTVATITFKGIGNGTSPVQFESGVLSDQTARPIPTDLISEQITATCTNPPSATDVPPVGPTDVPPVDPPVEPPAGGCQHTVQPGDTLYSLAITYCTTVDSIMAANGIQNPNLIYAGQTLAIPSCCQQPPVEPPPSGECFAYTVNPGDTLSTIATSNGDCVPALAQRNGIANPDLIYAGQVITVCPGCVGAPGGPPVPVLPIGCRFNHTVQPFETLYRLSMMYGTTVTAISQANGIQNPNLIYAGQVLCIP